MAVILLVQSKSFCQVADLVELAITRAVLFSSGVGYFEHTGQVEGDATLSLMFKTDQINDVLKSMVLMDFDGGSVSRVTYPSNAPVDRALSSFGVDISGDPSLPQLLKQLRGAKVEVMAPEKIAGSILNVETKTRVVGEPPAQITEHTLHLVTVSGIRSVNLSSIDSLTLLDPGLRDELDQALALLVASRDTQRKPVHVRFVGQGKRRTRVGYIVETPIWKTSYRLDLTPAPDDEHKPLLQGWAIVENTSDNDWKGVNLSLVSGRPISFVQDLYTPLYMPRPEVKPKLFASLTPRLHDEGIDEQAEIATEQLSRRRRRMDLTEAKLGDRVTGAVFGEDAAASAVEELAFQMGQGVQSGAYAEQLGELFHFTITHPVDLPRRRSAMLPIINDHVTADRVSLYNQRVLAKHPLNAVFLTNDTSMKLLGGPVTIFDGQSYAGDAQLDHLSAGEKRLLSYAIDLDVSIDPSQRSSNRLTAVKIVHGTLHITRMHAYEHTYKIKNKADRKKQVIIEQPFFANRKLVDPKAYEEKTSSVYRFRVPVEANTTGIFNVSEQQSISETIAILSTSPNALFWYTKQGTISRSVRNALEKAIEMKHELIRLERSLAHLKKQFTAIQEGQKRLRDNIATVGRESQLGKRYLAKLSDEEDQIESFERRIVQTRQMAEDKRGELAEYLKSLDVDGILGSKK